MLVGSSGEGGAKLHRRNFGEAVENLTGSGEYHWMAGNFLKYGAAEATFGSRNAGDIPVDAHELIALCAPRLTFISYGVPEKGDAKWLDQQGSYMATVAAGPVFRLLGAKDLGVSDDYRTEKMPPVNTGLLDGQLAWRQHDGGHTDRPNWRYFIPWANRLLEYTPPPGPGGPAAAARRPRTRTLAHAQLAGEGEEGGIDVYFEGDSITRRWGATDYPEFLANWNENFFGWNAANFGWGADRTENILWRLENGELDGVNPKVIVLLAGTNNVGKEPGDEAKVADITRGSQAILDACRKKAPAATIVLTRIFPRNDNMAVMPTITRINDNLAKLADGEVGALPQRQRQAGRRQRRPVRRHDGGQAAPDPEGLPGLGRRAEADPHGAARPPAPRTTPRRRRAIRARPSGPSASNGRHCFTRPDPVTIGADGRPPDRTYPRPLPRHGRDRRRRHGRRLQGDRPAPAGGRWR